MLIDGVPVKDYTISSLRSQIGIVTQEPIIFNDTIANNIAYSRPDATPEEIRKAAERANAHSFIVSGTHPLGYDEEAGEKGCRLSGGEKQRLSLARVILKDPEVILLDEATASLDSVSESRIQEALEPLLKEKTSLVVAHRLSTILDADRILVLQDGVICAAGKHAELLEQSEAYRTFYETQFKAAEEEAERQREALGEPGRRPFDDIEDPDVRAAAASWRHSQGRWQTEGDYESYY